MLKFIALFALFFIVGHHAIAQEIPYNPDEWDNNWTYEVFSDSFSGNTLNRQNWKVVTGFGRGKCVFVDLPNHTYEVGSGYLALNMLQQSGFCYTLNETEICPDYIAAELVSSQLFKYGVYEGRMKFAVKKGSWPAFWFFGGSGADNPKYNKNGYASEIDIAEHNWLKKFIFRPHHTDHVLHWWWSEEEHGTAQQSLGEQGNKKGVAAPGEWHIFKLIYTPFYLKFYVDGKLSWEKMRYYTLDEKQQPSDILPQNLSSHNIVYEHSWFPKHEGNIRLSQQVAGTVNNPVAPQTSLFDWVTMKQFFTAPVINAPDLIYAGKGCNAFLNVTDLATQISWSVLPADLFSGKTSGEGNTAILNTGPNDGRALLRYQFQMPGGEIFKVEKTIWISAPAPYE